MLQISHAELGAIKGRMDNLRTKYAGAIAKANDVVEKVVRTTEVGVSAFGFGVAQGKYGGIEVFGVPIDLLSSVVLHGAGFWGIGGKYSDHLHNFADGALASYLVTSGRGVGINWKTTGKLLGGGVKVAGGMGMSDDELARLAARE